MENQHILGFSIENFKRIGVFNIDTTDKSLVLISGKNESGKSSTIDAIHSALAGKSYWKKQIDEVIKEGEEEAHVVISTTKFEIHRYWKKNGKDYIKIKDKDGISQAPEETLLSKFYNEYSRDPHRMSELKEEEQTEFLLKAVGLKEDLDAFDDERSVHYDSRTDVNRDLRQAQSKLEGLTEYDSVPDVPDQSALLNEYEESQKHNNLVDSAEEKKRTIENEVDRLKKELKEQEAKLKEANEWIDNNPRIEVDELREQINEHETLVEKRNNANQYLSLKKDVEELQEEAQSLTDEIEVIDQQKSDLIKNAELPVDGMSLDDDGRLQYNGRYLKDLSRSQSIIFWSKIFLSTNPKLKFLTLDNAESLDSDNRKEIEKFAKENDLLYILTVVDESGEQGIVLEEGEIKTNNYEKDKKKK